MRDPVDYLEVIHNGDVHYSARLDEFAKAGGVIPAIEAVESGWVTLRVVTLHENHFRAAMSSPWYIEFDNQPRITSESIEFFQKWQTEHESRLKKIERRRDRTTQSVCDRRTKLLGGQERNGDPLVDSTLGRFAPTRWARLGLGAGCQLAEYRVSKTQ